jgi:hypothetical protein
MDPRPSCGFVELPEYRLLQRELQINLALEAELPCLPGNLRPTPRTIHISPNLYREGPMTKRLLSENPVIEATIPVPGRFVARRANTSCPCSPISLQTETMRSTRRKQNATPTLHRYLTEYAELRSGPRYQVLAPG